MNEFPGPVDDPGQADRIESPGAFRRRPRVVLNDGPNDGAAYAIIAGIGEAVDARDFIPQSDERLRRYRV